MEFQKGLFKYSGGVFIVIDLQNRLNVCVCVRTYSEAFMIMEFHRVQPEFIESIQCSKILGDSLSLTCFLLYYELSSPWHMCKRVLYLFLSAFHS